MESSGFEIIDTTADAGLLVFGEKISDLFDQAFAGLSTLLLEQMSGSLKTNFTIKKEFTLTGDSYENLMVTFLSELLFHLETKKWFPKELSIVSLSENKMKLFVQFIESNHYGDSRIKAVTYHNLEIVKTNGRYSTRIIFDL